MKRTVHRLVSAVNDLILLIHKEDITVTVGRSCVSILAIDVDERSMDVDKYESRVNNANVGQERY